mgnify:CR=1 FL=1
MQQKNEMGDYLYKNGNIYKIIPHWEILPMSEMYSIFLQESTGKMYCSPYLIKNDDKSYINATDEQIRQFDLAEKLYR